MIEFTNEVFLAKTPLRIVNIHMFEKMPKPTKIGPFG